MHLKNFFNYLQQHPRWLISICLLLFIPAYFGYLGVRPLWADEGTRALVALEMMLSQNYWVPTTNGELYFNKPPLYNWILIALFKLTGSFSEWVVRLPSVVPLMLFGITMYAWGKRHFSKMAAFLAAVMFVTCGRMLIYSSMLGHIDIFYSWVTFLSFWAIFHFSQKERWLAMFAISYFLASIGFLCKGLPSILFQGFTLVAWLTLQRKWKILLGWQHLLGGLVFVLLVGGYFLQYHQYHDALGWANVLWDQSAQRTVVDKAWYESLLHIFLFPIDQMGHLAPWSLLAIFLFRKGLIKAIKAQPILVFLSITLLINIPVYWLSPDVRPRYLFMLYPLLFMVVSWNYFQQKETWKTTHRVLETILGAAIVLSSLAPFGIFFTSMVIDFLWVKLMVTSGGLLLIGVLYFKMPQQRMVLLTIALLIVRIGFNFFILQDRIQYSEEPLRKDMAIQIGQKAKGKNLFAYTGLNHETIFYIERETEKILRTNRQISTEAQYIVYPPQVHTQQYQVLDSLKIRHGDRMLYLVQFLPENKPPELVE